MFERAHWTVKVDADSVFIPQRLNKTLRPYQDTPAGVYFGGNCQFMHMYGPIEILSRNAVLAYFKDGEDKCRWIPTEDIWMDVCLGSSLGVQRLDNFNILKAPACKPWMHPKCDDGTASAFHAFKDAKAWIACLRTALSIS